MDQHGAAGWDGRGGAVSASGTKYHVTTLRLSDGHVLHVSFRLRPEYERPMAAYGNEHIKNE
jgi:hypothetical protein